MSFETVVRPVVFPNIRPSPAQSQPPADDPTQGIATIHGASGQFLDLQYSWSASNSQSVSQEKKRKFDLVRVYQKDDDGTITEENFIDVEVAKKIWMKDGQIDTQYVYIPVQEADNIEIRERNKIKKPDK